LAGGAVFLQEYLDDRVHSPAEVAQLLNLPVLAQVSVLPANQPRLVDALPWHSSVAEAYRALRAGIGFAALDGPIHRLQIASPCGGEGRSTAAINLSIVLARDGKKVVLIDADLRSPTIHRSFGLPEAPGLSDVLAGMNSLEEVLHSTGIENLQVIPAGNLPPNPVELLGSRVFDRLLEQLEEQSDILVIDTPPCISVTDAVTVAARSDAVLLVMQVGRTKKAAVRQTLELLGRARARIVGLLPNHASPSHSGYSSPVYTHRNGHGGNGRPRHEGHRRNGSEPPPRLVGGTPHAPHAADSRYNDPA
jgi:capsular exopolysaccharide synthesis family protein